MRVMSSVLFCFCFDVDLIMTILRNRRFAGVGRLLFPLCCFRVDLMTILKTGLFLRARMRMLLSFFFLCLVSIPMTYERSFAVLRISRFVVFVPGVDAMTIMVTLPFLRP